MPLDWAEKGLGTNLNHLPNNLLPLESNLGFQLTRYIQCIFVEMKEGGRGEEKGDVQGRKQEKEKEHEKGRTEGRGREGRRERGGFHS